MPFSPPPVRPREDPHRWVLRAATVLWRVHARKHPSTGFNPTRVDRYFGPSRFSGTEDDPYPYFYAAFTEPTALAEALLRGIPFPQQGKRTLQRKAVAGRRLSPVAINHELTLLSLVSGRDLAAVCQDEWLVQAEWREFAQTRHWAHWLRAQAPWAQGLVWPSKRNLSEHAVMLFGDRCGPDPLQPVAIPPVDLDDGAGAKWLNDALEPYGARINRPRR